MTTPADYLAHARADVIALIPGSGLAVLDLGCGEGFMGAALKASGKAGRVAAVEVVERAAELARGRLDEVHRADLEGFVFPWAPGSFDVVVAADVLEHLRDPGNLLERARGVLKPGGLLVVSVPNVRYLPVVARLVLRGEFAYTDAGVLDRTHLRLFTARSVAALVREAGFAVERVVFRPPPSWKVMVVHRLSLGLARSFTAEQVLVTARKADA